MGRSVSPCLSQDVARGQQGLDVTCRRVLVTAHEKHTPVPAPGPQRHLGVATQAEFETKA